MRPSIKYNVTSQWNGGYVMEVFITNEGTQAIQDFQVGFDLDGTISDVWGGVIAGQSVTGYTIADDDDQNDIAPGETVRFKFKVLTDSGDMPSGFTVNDEPAAVNGVEPIAQDTVTESLDSIMETITDTVEAVACHPTSVSECCSVGDDKLLLFWDTRVEGHKPSQRVEGMHNDDINCVAWNSLAPELVATGDSDGIVQSSCRKRGRDCCACSRRAGRLCCFCCGPATAAPCSSLI